MALGGEIHHHVGPLLFKDLPDRRPVADVCPDKAEIGMLESLGQRGKIAGVGQLIYTDNAVRRVFFQHIIDKIRADKAGAAGHKIRHTLFCPFFAVRVNLILGHIAKMLPVRRFSVQSRALEQLRPVDPAEAVGDLLRSGDLDPLPLF